MGIFEVERDGKTFEVDAPDMQTAVNALGQKSYNLSEVPAAAAENFGESGGRVLDAFGEALSNPVRTAKDFGKLGIGMVQEMIPGQQEYETTHADPFYQRFADDYGSWDSIKRTLAEKPAEALLDASMVGSPLAGRVGQAARAVNLPYQAARGVTNVAKRAITPFPARPGFGEAKDFLKGEGIVQTAGQKTGNRALKVVESEIGGGAAANILDKQAEGFTRAASRKIGEDTPSLDPRTLNNSRRRIGNDFDQVGLRNNIPRDPQIAIDLRRAVTEYTDGVPIPVPGVEKMAEAIITNSATGMPGKVYNAYRSRLSRLQRGTKDPQLTAAYGDMREALDNAMERSLTAAGNTDDIAAFNTARQQYRNYVVLESAMATGAGDTARGLLTPQKLETAASSGPNRSWYARGLSDFSELGKQGRVGMGSMPDSHTAIRAGIRGTAAVAGGLMAGGGAIGPEAALGIAAGVAAPPIIGRGIMSGPAQAYLGNQVIPKNIPGQAAIGRAASTAIAATPRVESLNHLENVVSPKVLEHIKKAPSTRGVLNEWLKARYAGTDVEGATQRLAEAIALEVKRPDLVARIVAELSAAQN